MRRVLPDNPELDASAPVACRLQFRAARTIMPSLRFGFTPFGLRTPSAPPSGWSRSAAPERARSRWMFAAGAVAVAAAMGGWTAMRTVPWFGPLVADSLRSVVGAERVTVLEEAVATVEDRVNQVAS